MLGSIPPVGPFLLLVARPYSFVDVGLDSQATPGYSLSKLVAWVCICILKTDTRLLILTERYGFVDRILVFLYIYIFIIICGPH